MDSNMTNMTEDIREKVIEMDKKFRITLAVQATLSTFANLTVLMLYVLMGKKRKKIANYLLACTAVADAYVSGLSWYMFVISYMSANNQHYPNFETIAYIAYFLQDYSFILSLGTVLLSTVDRFISVKKPIQHRELTMKPNIKYVILIVWGVSFIPPVTRLALSELDHTNLYSHRDVIYIYCLHSFILFVIITTYCLLIKTFTTVRSIILNPVKGSRRTRDHLNTIHKRSRRLVKIFIAMISAYTITYLPIIISMILYTSGYLHNFDDYYVALVTVFADTFYLFSSLINPLITLSFKKDYRSMLMSFVVNSKLARRSSSSSSGTTSGSRSQTQRSNATAPGSRLQANRKGDRKTSSVL